MPEDALSRELQSVGARLILDEFVGDDQVFFFVEFPDEATRQDYVSVHLSGEGSLPTPTKGLYDPGKCLKRLNGAPKQAKMRTAN